MKRVLKSKLVSGWMGAFLGALAMTSMCLIFATAGASADTLPDASSSSAASDAGTLDRQSMTNEQDTGQFSADAGSNDEIEGAQSSGKDVDGAEGAPAHQEGIEAVQPSEPASSSLDTAPRQAAQDENAAQAHETAPIPDSDTRSNQVPANIEDEDDLDESLSEAPGEDLVEEVVQSQSADWRFMESNYPAIDSYAPILRWEALERNSSDKSYEGGLRLWGDNDYGTMSSIVRSGFHTCDTVIIATFDGYWDALAASSLAGKHQAPILLTGASELAQECLHSIQRLQASHAIVVGGTAVVSKHVEGQIRDALVGAKHVERIAGKTAIETAIEISKRTAPASDTCIVATVNGYWDALAASPYANAKQIPIYLTDTNGKVGAAALTAIREGKFSRILIVGGTEAVHGSAERVLASTGAKTVKRLAGDTAVRTSAEVAAWGLSQGMSTDGMGVATINGYWDALTGSALCGSQNAVLVLTGDTDTYAIERILPSGSRPTVRGAMPRVFGGTSAVSAYAYNEVARRVNEPCENGWQKYADAWHYFNDAGVPQTGLITYEGEKYYLSHPDGAMVRSAFKDIDGKKYYFTNGGTMATVGFVGGYLIAPNGTCSAVDVRSTGNKDADARRVAKRIAQLCPKTSTDLERVKRAAVYVSTFCRQARYTQSGPIYYTAYGVFIGKEYSCAGSTRALGLVLDYLGYPWSHANENQWSHQWNKLTLDGKVAYADGQAGLAGYGRHPQGG